MKALRPNRILYVLFGFGALLVFLLGAAFWHILIDGDSLDCSYQGIICLFIPDSSDWYIHLISYALMLPLVLSFIIWFRTWRKQWAHLSTLIRNLATLEIKDPKLEAVASSLDLKGKVSMLDSSDFLCFCACFASPRIYVSRAVVETLTATELEALVLHEKYHLKNYDPLRIFLGRLTASALFFLPVLKDLFQRYLIHKEMAADQFAITCQGNRRGIIGALQKLLQGQSSPDTIGFAVSGTEALKYRVNYMTGHQNKENIPLSHIMVSLIMPAIVIGAIAASVTIFYH